MAINGPAAPTASAKPPISAPPTTIPPLQNGDRLTAEEFLRRYSAMPEVNRAELIEGVVFMASPVKQPDHSGPHFDFIGWLFLYRGSTPGVEGGDNGTLRLDRKAVPQPDAFLMIAPGFGGQATIDDDGYVTAGPELVGEISATSASIDLGDKLNGYRRNGVREYVVWRVFDQIHRLVLSSGRPVRAPRTRRQGHLSQRGVSWAMARSSCACRARRFSRDTRRPARYNNS
jgi:hypothetical protein